MRIVEIPDDGIVRSPIMNGEDTVGEMRVDLSYLPTLEDVAPVVHAKWIDAREYCGDYMCSNCDALYGTNKFKYCPNCGAKMDLEKMNNENLY